MSVSAEALLDTRGVLDEIAEIHKRKPYFQHPVWAELVAGTLSREQVRILIR